MLGGRLVVISLVVTLACGCTYIPTVDQQDYCYADYAFEAEVKSPKELTLGYYKYEMYIHTVYKGDIKEKLATDTIYGEGPFFSCGPQILNVGTTYLIYAKERDGRVKIANYKEMDSVSDDDIVRMTTKYDCSCKIKFNYAEFRGVPNAPKLPKANENECNVPDEWCYKSGFCQRNDEGRCTWGELGSCN
ncbi:uncharacterized protein LOC133201965 [Saccostrea echinata]|uniref:uncharacterized protein LOC133201965 n=1 Tax=Saccostrea echinata TaxID=191078 RepID=UPI002A83C763|nr:uncharacterized protein LOC133201965 [Saccostrea echinata]